jgi:hypothetical protein
MIEIGSLRQDASHIVDDDKEIEPCLLWHVANVSMK